MIDAVIFILFQSNQSGGGGGRLLTMSFVVRLSTVSYFLCRTSLSIATRTDFCIRLEMT